MKEELDDLIRSAARIAASQAPRPRKVILLSKIADAAFDQVSGLTPCRKGCSACCHIAATITTSEAQAIADHIGRQFVPQPFGGDYERLYEVLNANPEKFYGVPCTFLRDGECSVYDVRPIACRVHHTVAPDASVCAVTQANWGGAVPQVNLRDISTAAALTFMDEPMADIRDFFPKEMK